MDMDNVIRRPALLEMIGVSSATQWRMEKAGLFPARFKLGAGLVGWHRTEVEEWLRNRDMVSRPPLERKTIRRAADRAGGNAEEPPGRKFSGLGDPVFRHGTLGNVGQEDG